MNINLEREVMSPLIKSVEREMFQFFLKNLAPNFVFHNPNIYTYGLFKLQREIGQAAIWLHQNGYTDRCRLVSRLRICKCIHWTQEERQEDGSALLGYNAILNLLIRYWLILSDKVSAAPYDEKVLCDADL